MSMKALEWAMYDVPAEMAKGSLLRILLALADHADTEGRGAFPSQKRLCALTGYSRRTIQHGLHDLEASGLIVKGDQRLTEHYGRHRPIVWNLSMEDFRGAKTAPLKKNESEAQHTTPQNSQEAQLGAQKTAVRGAIRGAVSLRPNLYKEESYIEPRESNARARKQITIPADWKPSEEHRALADRLGIDCDIEADKFRDRALDSGARSADWNVGQRRGETRARPDSLRGHGHVHGARMQGRGPAQPGRGPGHAAPSARERARRRIGRTIVRTGGGGMNAMTIAHMAGILTSAIQAADRLELDALKGPALADMDLDRIRDIKRDCSTCISLLEQIGREQR